MRELKLYDGKYTVINDLESGGGFYALRYGEKWQSLAGNNLVLAMFQEIEGLTEKIDEYEKVLKEIEGGTHSAATYLASVARNTLDKHNPHRSCPSCLGDCQGWVVDGMPCKGGE